MQICTLILPSQTGSSVCAPLICQRASCGLFGISEFRSQRNPDHHNIRNNVIWMPGAPFQTGFLPLLSGLSLVLLRWLVLSECPRDTFLETLQMVLGQKQNYEQAFPSWRSIHILCFFFEKDCPTPWKVYSELVLLKVFSIFPSSQLRWAFDSARKSGLKWWWYCGWQWW